MLDASKGVRAGILGSTPVPAIQATVLHASLRTTAPASAPLPAMGRKKCKGPCVRTQPRTHLRRRRHPSNPQQLPLQRPHNLGAVEGAADLRGECGADATGQGNQINTSLTPRRSCARVVIVAQQGQPSQLTLLRYRRSVATATTHDDPETTETRPREPAGRRGPPLPLSLGLALACSPPAARPIAHCCRRSPPALSPGPGHCP